MANFGVETQNRVNSSEQPSHKAIDNGNPAHFQPKWLVLDDVNIDLITVITTVSALGSYFLFHSPVKLSVLVPAAIILPLRLWFPRPKAPEGLVLITGASSGIGAELSYIFAEKGHELILVGRNEEQLKAVQKNVEDRYGKNAHTISSDLSLPGAAQSLYDRVKREGYTVDVLVNGAGLGGAGDTFSQPIELVERMTTLNCISLVQLTQLFGNDMIERRRGWLLHISSVGGKQAKSHASEESERAHPLQVLWPVLGRMSTMRPNTTCVHSQKHSHSNSGHILAS